MQHVTGKTTHKQIYKYNFANVTVGIEQVLLHHIGKIQVWSPDIHKFLEIGFTIIEHAHDKIIDIEVHFLTQSSYWNTMCVAKE